MSIVYTTVIMFKAKFLLGIRFRLEDYERNFNFYSSVPVVQVAENPDNVWPESSYKTVTSEHLALIPTMEDAIISLWLSQDGDNQALKKGTGLYTSDRVLTCGLLIKEKDYYFSLVCKAAMKKKVRYVQCCINEVECYVK